MRKEIRMMLILLTLALFGQILNASAASITNVYAQHISTSTVQIIWSSDIVLSSPRVSYGLTPETHVYTLNSDRRCEGASNSNNCILLTNLLPNTTYNYKVSGQTSSSNYSTSTVPGTINSLLYNDVNSDNKNFKTLALTGLTSTSGCEGISSPNCIISPTLTSSSGAATTTSSSTNDDLIVNVSITPTVSNVPVISTTTRPIAASGAVAILKNTDGINSINITWADNSNNETYFKIERSSTRGNVTLPTIYENSVSYTDNNLSPGTYTYYITACNNIGCSSGTVTSAITIAEPIIPSVTTVQPPVIQPIISTEEITIIKKLQGSVILTNGNRATDAEISAYKKETGKWVSTTTDSNGNYSINLGPGTWTIKLSPKNQSSSMWEQVQSNNTITFSNNTEEESKVLALKGTPLMSNIIVKVTDESGVPIANVGIIIDTKSVLDLNTPTSAVNRVVKTLKTDSNGTVTSSNVTGTYYVRTSTLNTMKYIENKEEKVTFNSSGTQNINITLKKEAVSPIAKITGTVKFDDGTLTEAYISAWSNEGGHKQTKTSTTGTYSLNLTTNQTWHIKASKDLNQKAYSSTEQTIKITSADNQIVDIVFVKNEAEILPPIVTTSKNITEQVNILATDGAQFTLPANGVEGSGQINVEIKPTVEAPSKVSSTVVSKAYDITIKNNYGQEISKLKSHAEILIPYDEKELAAKGVILENIIPSYYDETINSWVSVTNFTINKDKKVFVLHVDHLTRFALIAAADTTPPASPTGVVTDAITPTDVKISWKNPATDFNHSKVYRSDKIGTFGNIVAAEVFSNSFIDKTSSSNGKTYYYTVRSVDAAGNESTNSSQLAFTFKGGSQLAVTNQATSSLLLPPGQASLGKISRNLSLGNKGDDVTTLQKALKHDGFYATGPITGYYGKLTENAVFRFQNYYKAELLIPNGYKVGTGVLGPITKKKINEIIDTMPQ